MIINQIIPSNWNYNLIDQRFDIFKLTCCGSFNQNILDIQDDKVRFVSTVYLTGWTAFCMTDKNTVSEVEIKNAILKHFSNLQPNMLKVEKIPLLLYSRLGEQRILEMFDNKKQALLQLLINSTLNNPVFKEDAYNNITGRCYYYNKLWNDSPDEHIELVDFTMDNRMALYPTLVTFIKEKPQKPSYRLVYDTSRNVIRKAAKDDDESMVYYRKGIDGTHASRPAVGTTLNEWEKSRLACLAKFYTAIKEELAEYVSLTFAQRKTENLAVKSLDIGDDAIADIHRANGINVIDHIAFSKKEKKGTTDYDRKRVKKICECQQKVMDAIRKYCEENGIKFSVSDIRDTFRSNLCIVRDKDFYTRKPEMDDMHLVDENCVCQHVTVPFHNNGFDEMISVLLKELVIKSDLMEKKIRLTDWRNFGFETDMNFYIIRYSRNPDGTAPAQIAGMTIKTDGAFSTRQLLIKDTKNFDSNAFSFDDLQIINCFRSENRKEQYFDRWIEMALWQDDIFDAYIIKRTNLRALSDIEEMKRCFDDEKTNAVYQAEVILDIIKDFQYCGHEKHEEVCENICEFLKDKTTITKQELLPLLRPSKKEGQKIVTIDTVVKEAISERTNTILQVRRTNENERNLGIDAYRHIHLWLDEEYKGTKWCFLSYNYTVGMVDKPNQSIANSPVVRQIYRKDKYTPEREFIDKIISMLQVGFVNFKKYTVLPFPAKYLREMMNYQTFMKTTES